MKSFSYIIIICGLFFTFSSCKSHDVTSAMNLSKEEKKLIREKRKKEKHIALSHLPLDQYLRATQNIIVRGQGEDAKILIRAGSNTILANDEPLFVLNGIMVEDFSQIFNSVEVMNIMDIKVLKTIQETSFYGARGANGVIEIYTK